MWDYFEVFRYCIILFVSNVSNDSGPGSRLPFTHAVSSYLSFTKCLPPHTCANAQKKYQNTVFGTCTGKGILTAYAVNLNHNLAVPLTTLVSRLIEPTS